MSNLDYINGKLPDNVCVMIYGITAFNIFLEKLGDLWTGVVLPKQKADEQVKWSLAYLEYQKEGETCYLIWFFEGNCLEQKPASEKAILKEIKKFLKDRENEITIGEA